MKNAFFRKVMEKNRKHTYIKLVTTERRENYLFSKPNYHTAKVFTESWFAIEKKQKQK